MKIYTHNRLCYKNYTRWALHLCKEVNICSWRSTRSVRFMKSQVLSYSCQRKCPQYQYKTEQKQSGWQWLPVQNISSMTPSPLSEFIKHLILIIPGHLLHKLPPQSNRSGNKMTKKDKDTMHTPTIDVSPQYQSCMWYYSIGNTRWSTHSWSIGTSCFIVVS